MDGLGKYFGEEATRVIWEPLMRGKFGPALDQVSLVWIWGKVKLRGASRSKGGAKETLVYPRGSFEVLTQRLAEEVEKSGGLVRVSEGVERIETEAANDGSKRIAKAIVTRQGKYPCRAVLHTASARILSEICPELPGDWKQRATIPKHVGVACLILTLKRSLSRIYWMNIGERSIPFGGTMEQTNLVVTDTYGGKIPLYVSKYVYPDDPIYGMSADELVDHYLPHLQKINPEFSKDWIEERFLFRKPEAQPVIPCHYSGSIFPHTTPIDGLFLAHIAQIYPEDRGTNFSMKLAKDAVPEIETYLTT
jgi:protoporphyrinogen oxidase